jgi:hypothetical protein
MHHRRHRHRGFGGFRRGIGRGWYDRQNVLERLHEYQRDLGQELADVTELIKRLEAGEAQPETATV